MSYPARKLPKCVAPARACRERQTSIGPSGFGITATQYIHKRSRHRLIDDIVEQAPQTFTQSALPKARLFQCGGIFGRLPHDGLLILAYDG